MRYEEYKKVDLPWLDKIPVNWDYGRIKNYITSINGYAFSSSDFSDFGIRVIRISDFNESGFVDNSIVRIDEKYYNTLKKFQVKNKDIILCLTGGTVGKYYFVDNIQEVMLINQRVGIIRNKDSIDSKFLKYLISSNIVQSVVDFSKNSLNDNISLDDIGIITVPIPPKEDQEQIAKFLDWKINEIDVIIDKKKKLINYNNLVWDTYLNKTLYNKNKKENIKLKFLCDVTTGKEVLDDVEFTENAVPVYGSSNKSFKYTNKSMLDGDYIIFGRKGTIGQPYKLNGKFWIVDTAYAIKNNELVEFDFLYYSLCLINWNKYTTNTALPSIVANEVIEEKIYLPSKETQKIIIEKLNNTNKIIYKLKLNLQRQINKLEQLKQSLISDVVTGKIDVRNVDIPDYDKVSDVVEEAILEDDFDKEE